MCIFLVLAQVGKPPYIINLDPAVTYMPYGANIDIRDTVDYKNVMKQYSLGPNGGILTACNLFATRFDQVNLRSMRDKQVLITNRSMHRDRREQILHMVRAPCQDRRL